MNPMIGTRRTVNLAWQRYLPFSLANVQAYAPVQAGVYKIAVNLLNGALPINAGLAGSLWSERGICGQPTSAQFRTPVYWK